MYLTVEQLEQLGVPLADAARKARAETLIALAQSIIENATGQWFEVRTYPEARPMILDGSGEPTLDLYVPIISVSKILFSDVEQDLAQFAVYNSIPEDRGDPKIIVIGVADRPDSIYGLSASIFPAGRRNIKLVGQFGFVDVAYDEQGAATYSTPASIMEAVRLLVLRDLALDIANLGEELVDELRRRHVISETTDTHSYQLGALAQDAAATGLGFSTGIPDVDATLAMYRRKAVFMRSGTRWAYEGAGQ